MYKNNSQAGFSGIAAIGIVAAVVAVVIMFGYSATPKAPSMDEAAIPTAEQVGMEKDVTPAGKMENGEMMAKPEGSIPAKDSGTAMAKASGSYQIYDPAKLAMADNGGKVILFFNASWCPTCRTVDAELKSAQIPDQMVILSVDYDKYTELKKKYGVTYQHTFVQVDSKGNMIAKWSGGGMDDILSHVK